MMHSSSVSGVTRHTHDDHLSSSTSVGLFQTIAKTTTKMISRRKESRVVTTTTNQPSFDITESASTVVTSMDSIGAVRSSMSFAPKPPPIKPRSEVQLLRDRLGGDGKDEGAKIRSDFELKNKLSGLMIALTKKDRDETKRDGDSDNDEVPEHSPPGSPRAIRLPKAKRVFGGAAIQLSHRTQLVDPNKVIGAASKAAEVFAKRLEEGRQQYRKNLLEHQKLQLSQVFNDEDADDDNANGIEDGPTSGALVSSPSLGDGVLTRKSSLAFQPSVTGKAIDLYQRERTTTKDDEHSAARFGQRGDIDESDEDDEDASVDRSYSTSAGGAALTAEGTQRWKEAIWGSVEAWEADRQQQKKRRRRRGTRLDSNRSMSVTDMELLRPKNNIQEHDPSLWARENDPGELFAEFVSCVRSENNAWKTRFLPSIYQRPDALMDSTLQFQLNLDDVGSPTTTTISRDGHSAFSPDELPMLMPPRSSDGTINASAAETILAQKVTPRHSKGNSHTTTLPPINPSSVNKLITDLMDITSRPGAVSVVNHTLVLPDVKQRCRHCGLQPSAKDNQSLLAALQSLAMKATGNNFLLLRHALHRSTSASSTNDASLSDEASQRGSQCQNLINAANHDKDVYTGVLGDGASWDVLERVHPLIASEISFQSLMELDHHMWRDVAAVALQNRDDAAGRSADASMVPTFGGGTGTATERTHAAMLRAKCYRYQDLDSVWHTQLRSLELGREKELYALTKARDRLKHEYDASKSSLRVIQLELDESEVELAALKRKNDGLVSMSHLHSELARVERDMERLTVNLCDAEFTRRSIKKELSKVTWTATAYKDSIAQLTQLRGSLLSLFHDCGDAVPADEAVAIREYDVARPIDDAAAARIIYGHSSEREDIKRRVKLLDQTAPGDKGRKGGGLHQNEALAKLRDIIRTKVAHSTPSISQLKNSIVEAKHVDDVTDDVLADVDVVLKTIESVDNLKSQPGTSTTGGVAPQLSAAALAWSATASKAFLQDSEGLDVGGSEGQEVPAAREVVVVDMVANCREAVLRLMGEKCTHCDQFTGSSLFCMQRGDMHAAVASDSQTTSGLSWGASAGWESDKFVGTFHRLMWTTTKMATGGDAKRVVRFPLSALSGTPPPPADDVGSMTDSAEASHRLDSDRLQLLSTGETKKLKKGPSDDRRESLAERKHRKVSQSVQRRRQSLMMARSGDGKWRDEVQKDSSDSDSEVEYAEFDRDSEDEEIMVRRQSAVALLTHSSSPRKHSVVGFKLGGGNAAASMQQPSAHSFEEDDDEGNGLVEAVTAIFQRRRVSAVKDRLLKRKKLKDAMRTAKNAPHSPDTATLGSGKQESLASQGGGLDPAGDEIKKTVDLSVVNLLSVLSLELKWRMLAPLNEGYPVRPPSPPQPQPGATVAAESSPEPPIMRKFHKSQNGARVYETQRLPTTTITGNSSTAASSGVATGQHAIALSSAAVTASLANGATTYPLLYSNNSDISALVHIMEERWVRDVAPLFPQVSDRLVRRGQSLRPGVATPPRSIHKDIPVATPKSSRTPKKKEKSVVVGEIREAVTSQPTSVATPSPIPPPPLTAQHTASSNELVVSPTPHAPEAAVHDASVRSRKISPPKTGTPSRGAQRGSPQAPSYGAARSNAQLSEGQMAFKVDLYRRAINLAFQPAKQVLQKALQLERQHDELLRQLKSGGNMYQLDSNRKGVSFEPSPHH